MCIKGDLKTHYYNKSVLMWLNYLAARLINTLGGSEFHSVPLKPE